MLVSSVCKNVSQGWLMCDRIIRQSKILFFFFKERETKKNVLLGLSLSIKTYLQGTEF